MMLQSAKCPNCGADIQVNPNDKTAVCSFCRSNIIIKEAINLHNGAVETVTGEAEKERVLKMADDCLKNGFLSEAREKYVEVSQKYPNDYRGWFGIIQCNPVSDHNLDRMENEFKRAIAFAPEDIKEKIVEFQKHRNAQFDKILVLDQIDKKEKEKTKVIQKIQDVEEKITSRNNDIKYLEKEIKKERNTISSSTKTMVIGLLIIFVIGLCIVPFFNIGLKVTAYIILAIFLFIFIYITYSKITESDKRIEELSEGPKCFIISTEPTLSSSKAMLVKLQKELPEYQAELDKIKAEQERLESELASLS